MIYDLMQRRLEAWRRGVKLAVLMQVQARGDELAVAPAVTAARDRP